MNSKMIVSIIILVLVIGIVTGVFIHNNDKSIDSNNFTSDTEDNLTINNTTDEKNINMTNNTSSINPNGSTVNSVSNLNKNNKKQDKTQNIRKTRFSESEIIKISNRIMKRDKDYDPSIIKVSKIRYINEIWFVDYKNIKTGKKFGGTAISDKNGELATL